MPLHPPDERDPGNLVLIILFSVLIGTVVGFVAYVILTHVR